MTKLKHNSWMWPWWKKQQPVPVKKSQWGAKHGSGDSNILCKPTLEPPTAKESASSNQVEVATEETEEVAPKEDAEEHAKEEPKPAKPRTEEVQENTKPPSDDDGKEEDGDEDEDEEETEREGRPEAKAKSQPNKEKETEEGEKHEQVRQKPKSKSGHQRRAT